VPRAQEVKLQTGRKRWGKRRGCNLILGNQTAEEKSKSEFPSLLSMTLGKSWNLNVEWDKSPFLLHFWNY